MASKPLPLRLGIIGLSASAVTAWASSAHLPGLLTERGKKDYTIAALCNSSVEAAKKAIEIYKLPDSVKAYGNPEDLANDKDIDVVICATRVDKHYETILPSVKAGKDIFVEWPIAANRQQIDELLQDATKSGSKVAVGIQGRWVPPITKVRDIVESKKLGRVLSSDISAYGGINNRNTLPTGLKYFSDSKIGGNPITIGFGHMIDFTLSALGDFAKGSTTAQTQIQWKQINIFDPKSKQVVEKIETDVPDLITVQGRLTSKKDSLVPDTTMSVKFRRGQPFKGESAFLWHINCEKGEIRLESKNAVTLQASGYDVPPEIQIHHFADDTVENVPWEWSQEQLGVPVPARGIMTCLYALAEGRPDQWVSLEDAARRAEQIEAWMTSGKW